MAILISIGQALFMALSMFWEILWPLILGFTLSGFQKGASFTAAMVFELASTNLVIELGIILIVLMGWQFAVAEYLWQKLLSGKGLTAVSNYFVVPLAAVLWKGGLISPGISIY